jgi:hypothetical protein
MAAFRVRWERDVWPLTHPQTSQIPVPGRTFAPSIEVRDRGCRAPPLLDRGQQIETPTASGRSCGTRRAHAKRGAGSPDTGWPERSAPPDVPRRAWGKLGQHHRATAGYLWTPCLLPSSRRQWLKPSRAIRHTTVPSGRHWTCAGRSADSHPQWLCASAVTHALRRSSCDRTTGGRPELGPDQATRDLLAARRRYMKSGACVCDERRAVATVSHEGGPKSYEWSRLHSSSSVMDLCHRLVDGGPGACIRVHASRFTTPSRAAHSSACWRTGRA